ncbi:MAG TPA: S8 family serine peptidase [Acidobacteriota bacterium]|nr:S8 family serine peptidase [Acidobacteriota bacterium]
MHLGLHRRVPAWRRAAGRWTATLLLVLAAISGSEIASAKPKSVHPALRNISPGAAMHERFLSRRADGAVLVDLLLEGSVSPSLLRARGIEVNTVAGGWMTARCPLGLLGALLETDGLERVRIAERCEPYLDVSAIDAGVSTLRTVGASDITGQTGEGIVVGIVDSGVDLAHPDLRRADGTTRLLSIWDQSATSGTPPGGFTYGAEWDSAAINDGIPTEIDTDGHGTHVITTAAGNGRATGNGHPAGTYVGVAPEADVVAVKTTFATSAIIDGVRYVFTKAAFFGKKAVVNLSLGTQAGPHDGTYEFDTMISALTGPGKIVVASAGNKQNDDIHGRVTLSGTTPGSMTLSVPAYTKNPGTVNDYLVFSGWYGPAENLSVTVVSPNGFTAGPVPLGETASLNSQDGQINIFNGTTLPPNGDNEVYLEVFDEMSARAPQPGLWTITFTPTAVGGTGVVDLWLYGNSLGSAGALAKFVQGLATFNVIGSPGSADSVIAVAAHVTKNCWDSVNGSSFCWTPLPPLDGIAPFSSTGPLRDGTLKPDLSAPGDGVAAARSANSAFPIELVVPDGVHAMLAGTSMSAPHVTGTVALLLAQPAWANAGPSAIKNRLQSTARADAFTGAVPNATWGYGKLNAAAALAPLATLQIVYPPKGSSMPPGRPDSVTVVTSLATADSVMLELSVDGGGTYPYFLGTLYGVAPGPARALHFFVEPEWTTLEAKIRGTARFGPGTITATSDSLFIIQSPVGVETAPAAGAPRLALEGNRPNPFNPVTTIGFELPATGRATLRVYSVQGALVRTLLDRTLPAGRFSVAWDGRDERGLSLGSGLYLSELIADGKRLTRKMSLLK